MDLYVSVEESVGEFFPIKGNELYKFLYRNEYFINFFTNFVSEVSVKKNSNPSPLSTRKWALVVQI
jgi:hypothetical protein